MKPWYADPGFWLSALCATFLFAVICVFLCSCGDDRPFKPGVYDVELTLIQSDYPFMEVGHQVQTEWTIKEDEGDWTLRVATKDWWMTGHEEGSGVIFTHHQDMDLGHCEEDEYNDLDVVLSEGSTERKIEGIAHSLLKLCASQPIEEEYKVDGRLH